MVGFSIFLVYIIIFILFPAFNFFCCFFLIVIFCFLAQTVFATSIFRDYNRVLYHISLIHGAFCAIIQKKINQKGSKLLQREQKSVRFRKYPKSRYWSWTKAFFRLLSLTQKGFIWILTPSQVVFNCSKSTMEAPEQYVKSVQS